MSDPQRTVELIWSEMEAEIAKDGESFSAERYEELEAERLAILARGQVAKRHQAYASVGAPAVVTGAAGVPEEDAGFYHYLRTGVPNSDLKFAQTEGTSSAGGYATPDSFLARLVEKRTAWGGLMGAAESITTESGAVISYPSVAAALYSDADIAAEGAASAVGADIVFAEVALGAYKYVATGTGNVPLKVSVELLQDAIFDIGAFVARRLGDRITRKQAYDLINGSNSGMPQGIAYGTAGTTEVDPTGFAALNTIKHTLDPEYRERAQWIMNDATLAVLEGLLDGASGTSGRPLLTYGQGMEDSASHGRLLGHGIIIDQAMPTWGADDVIGIAFGDWKEAYIVRHVKDVTVIVNPYTSANTGYVEYNAWARMDGKVQNSAAYVTGEGV